MTAVRLTFDRIGRDHNVSPQVIGTVDADSIAQFVYGYAKGRLLSRDVEVVVDMEALRGYIYCGFRNGGTFTIEPIAAVTS